MNKQTNVLVNEQQNVQIPEQELSNSVVHFEIQYYQMIDYQGNAVISPLPEIANDQNQLIKLYQAMLKTRLF
ncbi:MAG: hypothetical protein V3U84_11880, partial [Thiotrichaceae bacterium]